MAGSKTYHTGPASPFPQAASHVFPRSVYAAAHVVADPSRLDAAGMPGIDWDGHARLSPPSLGLGFSIAEAMDTSQRGMGLAWPQAKELIARSLAEAHHMLGADLACGAGTDQLDPAEARGHR